MRTKRVTKVLGEEQPGDEQNTTEARKVLRVRRKVHN
jgi:hypothetical protein